MTQTRILVADDSTEWSKPFCDFLERWGYRAESVATGKDLMDSIQSNPDAHDILIVDNSMPEHEGAAELPYCGVLIVGRLVAHFRTQEQFPAVLEHVIVRSIYSREDLKDLRREGDPETQAGCDQVAVWLDRNVTLDELMGSITRLANAAKVRRR